MPTYHYIHKNDLLREFCYAPRNRQDPVIEIQHPINQDALVNCPECGGAIERVIAGSVHVTWKGGAPTSKTYI